VQVAQRRPRLETGLLDQAGPAVGVDLQGLRLPSGPVQREHQVAAEVLAEGVRPHQALQLGHLVPVPAERQQGSGPDGT
jgi:hypothetical protein